MALTITGLSKTYPNGVQALKNLSLTIGNNMFGLLGPNGAGKSSLMRTIATLQDPDSGTIFLDDLNVLKEKDAVRRVLGYLPQEFGVYPKMSALDMLQHLAINHTAEVWRCFRSWLRTMNPAMPPSELIVASALRTTLPVFIAVPAFAADLTKIMAKYRRHDPPPDEDRMAA